MTRPPSSSGTANARRVVIVGLLSNIHSLDEPAFPLLYRELCVFLALTEARGVGTGQVVCVYEETGEKVLETPERRGSLGRDPLDVVAVPFRKRDCPFPSAKMYQVQFWYNGEKLCEQPLRLR